MKEVIDKIEEINRILKLNGWDKWMVTEPLAELKSLLQSQERVADDGKTIEVQEVDEQGIGTCGSCKVWPLHKGEQEYCHHCGTKLKWPNTKDNEVG